MQKTEALKRWGCHCRRLWRARRGGLLPRNSFPILNFYFIICAHIILLIKTDFEVWIMEIFHPHPSPTSPPSPTNSPSPTLPTKGASPSKYPSFCWFCPSWFSPYTFPPKTKTKANPKRWKSRKTTATK